MTQPALDVLLPPGSSPARLEPQADEAALVALVERGTPSGAGRAQRLVRANMIATLDGGATGPDHVTGSINGPADLRVFRALRVLADVVLVGAGTVRQERYRDLDLPAALERTRRDHGRPDPVRLAVVTAAGDPPTSCSRPPLDRSSSRRPPARGSRCCAIGSTRTSSSWARPRSTSRRPSRSSRRVVCATCWPRAARRCSAGSSDTGSWTSCS